MAIIVENGSGVASANSYVSEAELTAYATARGLTLTGSEEQLLIKAMDYIESLPFKGIKKTRDQVLQWPRINVVIDGYYLNTSVIPNELKNGQMATAIAIDAGDNPLATLTQGVKREKVDVVEVEYMNGSPSAPIIKTINSALWKLLVSGSNGNIMTVSKG